LAPVQFGGISLQVAADTLLPEAGKMNNTKIIVMAERMDLLKFFILYYFTKIKAE
jgi:hypothetical protein